MKVTTQLVPPGDWKYQQGAYLIKSDTFDSLVADIKAHRISNGIEVGNVVEDVKEQISKNNPSFKFNWPKLK